MRKFLLNLSAITLTLFSQQGPGGVGDSTNNVIWLKADAGVVTSGSNVTTWNDQSGNGNNFTGSGFPILNTNQVNGQPAINFGNSEEYLQLSPLTNMPDTTLTMVLVLRTSDTNDGIVSYETSSSGNELLLFGNALFVSSTSSGSFSAINDGNWKIATFTWRSAGGVARLYRDGNFDQSRTTASGQTLVNNGSFILGEEQDGVFGSGGTLDPAQSFDGDIAELVLFNTVLDSTERILMENYLSTKYNISIGNDHYALEGTGHQFDLAGVGRESATDDHLIGFSDIFGIEASSFSSDDDYILYAHNDSLSSFQLNDVPAGIGTRLRRVWRVDLTGSPGAIDLKFNVAAFGLGTGQAYRVLTDADGTFSNATIHTGSVTNDTLTISALSLTDNDYITLARTTGTPDKVQALSYSTDTLSLAFESSASSVSPTVDDGGSPVTAFSIDAGAVAGITINTSTGVVSANSSVAIGTYTLDIQATNAGGDSIFTSAFVVEVTAIAITNLAYSSTELNISHGESVNLTATVTPSEPTGGTYTFSWDLPSNPYNGLSLNTSTGTISGTPNSSLYNPRIRVLGTNNASGSDSITIPITVIGSTGPAGVGSSETNVVWLHTASGVSTSGSSVTAWADQSGNANDFTTVGANTINYATNQVNGEAALQFAGDDRGLILNNFDSMPNIAMTYFAVVNTSATGNEAIVSYATAANNNEHLVFPSSTNTNVYVAGTSRNFSNTFKDGNWNIISSTWSSNDGVANFYRNSTSSSSVTYTVGDTIERGGSLVLGEEQDNVGGGFDAAQNYDGDLTEYILFNSELNNTQRIIIENYLSTKYNISISSNDHYAFGTTYSGDLAGIGRESATDDHLYAFSNIMELGKTSFGSDGDYVLFAHNNSNLAFQASDVPSGAGSRLQRVWRADLTGSPGTVDVRVDVSSLSLGMGQEYRLLIDGDATFSNATVDSAGTLSNDTVTFTNITIADGAYFTLARSLGAGNPPQSLTYSTDTLTIEIGSSGSSVSPTVDDGGAAITAYSISSGGGTGISINSSSGVVSADASTAIGTYNLSIQLSNAAGDSIFTNAYTVIVQIATITNISYSNSVINEGEAVSLTASVSPSEPPGGTFTFSWSFPSNPYNGLSLNTSSGLISGSPNVGFYQPLVRVVGSVNASGSDSTTVSISVIGSTGPAGVGSSESNVMWFRADSGVTTSASNVTAWNDQSGNGNNLGTVGANSVAYATNQVNSLPALQFAGDDRGLILNPFNSMPKLEMTYFLVVNTSGTNEAPLSYATTSDNNEMLLFQSTQFLGGVNNNFSGSAYNNGSWNIVSFTWRSSDGAATLRRNSTTATSSVLTADSIEAGGSFVIGEEQDNVGGGFDAAQNYDGDLAEVILFNAELNAAQRIIVENNLSTKYNISIGANDHYSHDASHGSELAGIGRESSSADHLFAWSDQIQLSKSAGFSSDGDYLLFAHNDSIAKFKDTDRPATADSLLRRQWRVDITGSPGAVNVRANVNAFNLSGSEEYLLVKDADGVFATGAETVTGVLSGDTITFSNVTFNDGDYFTLAISNATAKLTVSENALGTSTIANNATDITIFDFNVSPSDGSPIMTDINFDVTSTGSSIASSTSSATLYKDTDGSPGITTADSTIATATFNGDTIKFNSFTKTISATERWGVIASFNGAGANGSQFTDSIAASSNISLSSGVVLGTNFPISGRNFTFEGMTIDFNGSLAISSPNSLNIGDEIEMVSFEMTRNVGSAADSAFWNGLTINQRLVSGTPNINNVDSVKLYQVDASLPDTILLDAQVLTADGSGGTASFSLSPDSARAPNRNQITYLVTYKLETGFNFTDEVGIQIPANGFSFTTAGNSFSSGLPFQKASDVTLPVTLGLFSGKADKNGIFVNLRTLSEPDLSTLYVKRKNESTQNVEIVNHFEMGNHVSSGADYSFLDQSAQFGVQYSYSLEEHFLNGSFIVHEKHFTASRLVPKQFSIGKAYPNPFNPVTTIDFEIPENSLVEIQIFNLLGQLIKSEKLNYELGYRSYQWNAQNQFGNAVASGMYYIKISAVSLMSQKRISEVQRLILIK